MFPRDSIEVFRLYALACPIKLNLVLPAMPGGFLSKMKHL